MEDLLLTTSLPSCYPPWMGLASRRSPTGAAVRCGWPHRPTRWGSPPPPLDVVGAGMEEVLVDADGRGDVTAVLTTTTTLRVPGWWGGWGGYHCQNVVYPQTLLNWAVGWVWVLTICFWLELFYWGTCHKKRVDTCLYISSGCTGQYCTVVHILQAK